MDKSPHPSSAFLEWDEIGDELLVAKVIVDTLSLLEAGGGTFLTILLRTQSTSFSPDSLSVVRCSFPRNASPTGAPIAKFMPQICALCE